MNKRFVSSPKNLSPRRSENFFLSGFSPDLLEKLRMLAELSCPGSEETLPRRFLWGFCEFGRISKPASTRLEINCIAYSASVGASPNSGGTLLSNQSRFKESDEKCLPSAIRRWQCEKDWKKMPVHRSEEQERCLDQVFHRK